MKVVKGLQQLNYYLVSRIHQNLYCLYDMIVYFWFCAQIMIFAQIFFSILPVLLLRWGTVFGILTKNFSKMCAKMFENLRGYVNTLKREYKKNLPRSGAGTAGVTEPTRKYWNNTKFMFTMNQPSVNIMSSLDMRGSVNRASFLPYCLTLSFSLHTCWLYLQYFMTHLIIIYIMCNKNGVNVMLYSALANRWRHPFWTWVGPAQC